jgi:hypothetical protein
VSQSEKSSVLEMLGEFLREIAVLVLVFVPLEVWKGAQGNASTLAIVLILTAVVSILSLVAGIIIERIRP